MIAPSLPRRLFAEFLGTGLLVTIVVGSGIAAQRLSPDDAGLQLLENSTATALGLAAVIWMLAPVSGAHLNPVVTVADLLLSGRLPQRDAAGYLGAQVVGGVSGALLANAMFEVAPAFSTHHRATAGSLLGEVVATAALLVLIFGLARTDRSGLVAPAVGAYIGAAYWFTSSTSFANPAVTVARMLSDTFAGIAPSSVPAFLAAQAVGLGIGVGVTLVLYPGPVPAPTDR